MDSVTSKEKKGELEKELLAILHKRLSWEFTIEYGLNLRLGRTLTKSQCSSAYIHPETIETVLSDLIEPLQNEFMLLRSCDNTQIQQFVLGLLTRLVDRGGIDHPMIRSYIENENRFLLYKYKNTYMSPFGGNIRLPKFLTNRQGGRIFDCYITSQRGISWFLDWARRSLNENIDTNISNDIYAFVVQQLLQKNVLKEYDSIHGKNNKVYALNPEILSISSNVIPLISPKDGSHQTIRKDDKSLWDNMPSIAYRGKNCFYEVDESPRGTYYQKVYKSGRIKRIFAQEHSSILGRDKREEVESLFKDGGTPDAPNLITCTPTMEMGIDVGDLSATMVCSVPPSTTNYLQRIGRAGRSTGNALVLALANAKPHDLYFYEDPQEMISGIIHTPGCFLNAPEMLKRHFTAFCMDLWAETADKGDLPNKMASIIKNSGASSSFPNSFYEYYEKHKDEIIKLFLNLFS
jgi:DEAD/DEAH box helicase domain-containing protein